MSVFNELEHEMIKKQLKEATESARRARRLDAVRTVLEKSNTIMIGKRVPGRLAEPPSGSAFQHAPGWTDGRSIAYNQRVMFEAMSKLPREAFLLRFRGVNYHELGHMIFTPRNNQDFGIWLDRVLRDRQTAQAQMEPWRSCVVEAFNMLEDQRMETAFTTLYPSTIPYFRASALQWAIDHRNASDRSHLLVWGRKFLSKKTRNLARAAFAAKHGDGKASEAARIIDEYLLVVFPTNMMKAQRLVLEFAKLLWEQGLVGTPSTSAHRPPSYNSRSRDEEDFNDGSPSSEMQKKANSQMKQNAESWDSDDDDDDDDEGESQGSQQSDASDDSSESNEDGGQGEDDNDSDENEAGDTSESDGSEDDYSGGQGASQGAPDPGEVESNWEDEVAQACYDELNTVLDDDEFQQELSDLAKTVGRILGDGGDILDGRLLTPKRIDVDPVAARSASVLATNLRKLRTDLEEEHRRRLTAGQIDVERFMHRMPWDTDFFRAWEPGQYEEAEVEAVILVDLSSSMAWQMERVSVALWVLRYALQRSVDADVTVLGYSDHSYSLFRPSDPTPPSYVPVWPAINGTVPDEALTSAHRILTGTSRTNRLLISLTDGQWGGDPHKQRTLVNDMRAQGVVTCLIELTADAARAINNAHHHEVFHVVKDVAQLPAVGVDLIAAMLRTMLHA